MVGATNLIPGPNSTEMTMHCGLERAGWKGLLVAGGCFILPAVIITGVFAWAYQHYGSLPQVTPFIYGIKPAVIALIVAALISLGKKALKSVWLVIIGLLSAVAMLMSLHEIGVLFGAGFLGMLYYSIQNKSRTIHGIFPFVLLQALQLISVSNAKVFFIFLKIGALLYGSGYVLFAFVDAELVSRGWLSQQQLIDAIAVGQFTPGPVFSAATFIGWQIGGMGGAIAATIGVFLPSFLFVALLNPLIPKLRKSQLMAAFLDAVNVAAVAIILSVAIRMASVAIVDWRTAIIGIMSFLVVFLLKKVNAAFIVLGGSILGYLLYQITPF
jgi:chromate transporter